VRRIEATLLDALQRKFLFVVGRQSTYCSIATIKLRAVVIHEHDFQYAMKENVRSLIHDLHKQEDVI
jgi:hypothetical protein